MIYYFIHLHIYVRKSQVEALALVILGIPNRHLRDDNASVGLLIPLVLFTVLDFALLAEFHPFDGRVLGLAIFACFVYMCM